MYFDIQKIQKSNINFLLNLRLIPNTYKEIKANKILKNFQCKIQILNLEYQKTV